MSIAFAAVAVFVFFAILFFVVREAIRSACRSEFRTAQWADEAVARNHDRLTAIDRRSGLDRRRGAVAVEFAIVAPLFFLFIMTMVEFGRGIMIYQQLTAAANHGARVAMVDGATMQDVKNAVAPMVVGIRNYGVDVSPNTPYAAKDGQTIAVTVYAQFNSNSWLPIPRLLGGVTLTATATAQAERVH